MNTLIYLTALAVSASVGSFLTVLAHRLPRMLLKADSGMTSSFNLIVPRSHCPHCAQSLRIRHMIPIVSYIVLKGRCAYCFNKIQVRYLLIELGTLICSLIIIRCFGFTPSLLAGLVFTWGAIAIAVIDWEHYLIPDIIVLPLLWLGLFLSVFSVFIEPEDAIAGAMCGYLSLWLCAWIYYFITKRTGMGHGDFKCFAMLGSWLGVARLPYLLLFAALMAIGSAMFFFLRRKIEYYTAIPFGPFLVCSGWLIFLWQIGFHHVR